MAYSFPEEVLEHVFSFLTTDKDRNAVSVVCKSWYEIERWCRRRIFVGNCYAVSPRIMIRRFPEVRSVELKGKPHFADFNLVPEGWGAYVYPWILAMSRSYPWLEEIKLKRMVITDESLELISKSFKNFKVLVLSSCDGFTTDGLAAIAANCRNLRMSYKKLDQAISQLLIDKFQDQQHVIVEQTTRKLQGIVITSEMSEVCVDVGLQIDHYCDDRILSALEESSSEDGMVPASESSIELLELMEADERNNNDECLVCLDELGEETDVLRLPCSHMFHC